MYIFGLIVALFSGLLVGMLIHSLAIGRGPPNKDYAAEWRGIAGEWKAKYFKSLIDLRSAARGCSRLSKRVQRLSKLVRELREKLPADATKVIPAKVVL